jgi:hypothetical protein
MHKGHHGYPDLIDDHLPEKDLSNVWSVPGLLGNTLKGLRCLRWFWLYSETPSADIREKELFR